MTRSALLLLLLASCGAGERDATTDCGLVLRVPADWIEARGDGSISWSGAQGTPEWRTTVNVHSVGVTSDEVSRNVDAVARALLVKYRHLGARTRLVRGEDLAGRAAVRLEVRFEHRGTWYHRRHFVVRRADRIVHLDATAPEDQWERVEPILERAVESARWEET